MLRIGKENQDDNEEEGGRGGGKIVLAFKKYLFDPSSSNSKIQQ